MFVARAPEERRPPVGGDPRDEQPEAAARRRPARATPPTPDPRGDADAGAASTPTPRRPRRRDGAGVAAAPPPRIVANGPPSPSPRPRDALGRGHEAPQRLDLADHMVDAEDDASLATRPRSPATVVMSDRPEGHARRDRGRTGGLSDRVGSFYFVAPEVLRGDDARCDLWSMGVIVYVLLSGPLLAGRTDREILSRAVRAPPQFPARLWRGAPHEARPSSRGCPSATSSG